MKNMSKAAIVTLVGLLLVLSLIVGCAQVAAGGASAQPSASTTSQSASNGALVNRDGVQSSEDALAQLYENVSPGVVYIENVAATSRFTTVGQQTESSGSGFVIDTNGLILTNNHVVTGAKRVVVTLPDGSQYDAKVLGTDSGNDIALIKIDADASLLHPLTLGDSEKIKVGQTAVAIGNPFGYERTMTTGIISSVGRSLSGETSTRPMRSLIQTDTAINPGNSGGVLLNTQGEVIGITTAIQSPVSGSVGVGFAVPINSAKTILDDLKAGKTIDHAWLGISGWAVNAQLNQKLNLGADKGTYLVSVVRNGPAEKAGLKGMSVANTNSNSVFSGFIEDINSGGDVITAIDGKVVSSIEQVASYVDTKKPGDVVSVTLLRNKAEQTIKVTLEKWPESLSTRQ